MENLTDIDWRKPIVEYLENPTGISDRKLKYKSMSYMITGNQLFKKNPEEVLFKFFGDNEAYLAVSNVHSRACSAHQVGHKMRWLLCRQGVYWSTMLKDCIDFSKGCQEFQVHAGI